MIGVVIVVSNATVQAPRRYNQPGFVSWLSVALYALGALLILGGAFGYMAGDLQLGFLSEINAQVKAAQQAAQSGGIRLTGMDAGLSFLLGNAIVLFLIGLLLVFNGYMMRAQPWERFKDLLCIEPALFFFLLFVYYPVVDLLRISFTNWNLLKDEYSYVGLKNYKWLFTGSGWKYFIDSLRITATYTFWEIFITLVGGMLLALLFNRMTRLFNAMRAIVFMPKYIAVSTSAIVFIWILNGQYGILNYVLGLFGITGPNWLNEASTALAGILFLTAWRVVGYAMMIYLSAMQSIPQDYYEAASIDGADGVHRFRYITMPLLAPTTLFLFVTTFIASMKVFQSVDVMTRGGPYKATNVVVQWVYLLAFEEFRIDRAAVVSVIFFFILLICTAATMKYSNRSVNYDQ